MRERERERERERGRQIKRGSEGERETHTERRRERETDGERGRETETDIEAECTITWFFSCLLTLIPSESATLTHDPQHLTRKYISSSTTTYCFTTTEHTINSGHPGTNSSLQQQKL